MSIPDESVTFNVVKNQFWQTRITEHQASAIIILSNVGGSDATHLSLVGYFDDGTVVPLSGADQSTHALALNAIPIKETTPVSLTFPWTDSSPRSGWLVITDSEAKADPLSVPFTIEIETPGWLLLGKTAAVALIETVVIMFFVFDALRKQARDGSKKWKFSTPIKTNEKWTFKDSFATNLTAVGAIITTLLAATGFLNEVLPGLSIGIFVAVSLFYAFFVLLGPPTYAAGSTDQAGTAGGLLAAAAITTWAVLGELATAASMIHLGGLPGPLGTILFLIALIVIWVYVYRTCVGLIVAAVKKPDVSTRRSPIL